MAKLKQLQRFRYEFEWKHEDGVATITSMTVRTPISNKIVSMLSGPSVIVYAMLTERPFIATIGRLHLQDLEAIIEEIKAERKRLWEEQDVEI